MAVVGEIRQNPGGRRLLLLGEEIPDPGERRPRGALWTTLQLNGRWPGARFGVPTQELDGWELIATLPPDPLSTEEST